MYKPVVFILWLLKQLKWQTGIENKGQLPTKCKYYTNPSQKQTAQKQKEGKDNFQESYLYFFFNLNTDEHENKEITVR